MKIQDAVYDECGACGSRRGILSDDLYGCDSCKKPIEVFGLEAGHRKYLEVTVFFNDGETSNKHLHFCSWDCVLEHLPKIKTDYFFTLPYLVFDGLVAKRQSGQHLVKLLRHKATKESANAKSSKRKP